MVPKKTGPLPRHRRQTVILSFGAVYLAIQIFIPLAHFCYPGGIEWTYAEHHFAWQMMVRRKSTTAFFYVTDPNSGQTHQVKPREYLGARQLARMGWRPDMVQQFARYLTTAILRDGPEPLKVQVRMFVSINGRKPRLFLDPNVDLAAEPHVWGRPRWLLHVDEPLPPIGKDFTQDLFVTSSEGN